MPNIVFLSLGALMAFFAWKANIAEKTEIPEDIVSDNVPEERELSWEDVQTTDILGLEVGYGLIPLVDAKQGGKLPDRIKAIRRKLTEQLGFLIHAVHIKDNLDLAPTRYRINLLGVTEGEADIYPGKELAIGAGIESGVVPGIAAKDPAYGMDAIWIDHDLSLIHI